MNSIITNLAIHYGTQYVASFVNRTVEYFTATSQPRANNSPAIDQLAGNNVDLRSRTVEHSTATTQPKTNSSAALVGAVGLKSPEVEVKRKELHERAFTTFCLENWNEKQIDSLADLARNNDQKFVPHSNTRYTSDKRDETDSYDKNTSYLRRAFVEGSPQEGFKVIETVINPFSDDGSLMAHPLVNSVLAYIYELLPGELRPGQDRIEISLIRQCASQMPELLFHRDLRRQVFVVMLACNFEETDGAEMSVKDKNRVLSEKEIADYQKYGLSLPVVEDVNYHYSNRPSSKGNGYLVRENTDTTKDKDQNVQHRRGAFSTKVTNPERITLRILIDSKDEPVSEAI